MKITEKLDDVKRTATMMYARLQPEEPALTDNDTMTTFFFRHV